jgi:hypothetical protein
MLANICRLVLVGFEASTRTDAREGEARDSSYLRSMMMPRPRKFGPTPGHQSGASGCAKNFGHWARIWHRRLATEEYPVSHSDDVKSIEQVRRIPPLASDPPARRNCCPPKLRTGKTHRRRTTKTDSFCPRHTDDSDDTSKTPDQTPTWVRFTVRSRVPVRSSRRLPRYDSYPPSSAKTESALATRPTNITPPRPSTPHTTRHQRLHLSRNTVS